MQAKDVMRKKIITVGSWLTLPELARVLEENAITGAPVVDEAGQVLGVVSQTDLVRSRGEASAGVPLYHRELDEPVRSLGMHFEEVDESRVEQVMTPGAISFDAATPVEQLAGAMLERRIHRVLITSNGRLAGIVTTMDLLRALVVLAKRTTPAKRAAPREKKRAPSRAGARRH